MEGWPPDCIGWTYQPIRPVPLQKEENILYKKVEKQVRFPKELDGVFLLQR